MSARVPNPAAETARRAPSVPAALGIYAGLCVCWIALIQAIRAAGLPPRLGWITAQLVLPVVLAGVGAALVHRLPRTGSFASAMRLGRPARGTMTIAIVAGLPALLVLLWHVEIGVDGWLWSSRGGMLALKLLVNQALLEEWLARGMLLGWLVAAGQTHRKAIWASAAAFALMHMLQYLVPPITPARLLNGVVLIAFTLPLGAVLAQLTLRARSIWPAVVLHFATDLTILPQQLSEPRMMLVLLGALAPIGLVPLLLMLATRRRGPDGV